jgi:hypothetical protein
MARPWHSPGHRFRRQYFRVHWDTAKRVHYCFKGTKGWRLTLGGKSPDISLFTGADWGSHRNDRRSIRAYIIKIGNGAVSRKSKKQSCVALSSTVPYPALSTSISRKVSVYFSVRHLRSAYSEGPLAVLWSCSGSTLNRCGLVHGCTACSCKFPSC